MCINNHDSNKRIGQFFTPDYIAEFMVKNAYRQINKSIKKDFEEITVLEPSVGKGIFLHYLLDYGFKNITAYEIDTSLKDILINKYPTVNFKFKNILAAPLEKKYDLIIGNPPYLGQNYNSQIFQDYIKKYPLCKKYFVGNMDLFYYFIHIGIEKLQPSGILSYITTNYWITKSKKTGIKFLKPHILEKCLFLQYFDLSNMILFNKAKGQHNCIFTIQNKDNRNNIREIPNIDILSIKKSNKQKIRDLETIKIIFKNLIDNKKSNLINRYDSALSFKDLKKNTNWNLLYPDNVKKIVDKYECLCKKNGRINLLKDYFIIRNGIIFIKDGVFILEKSKNLLIKNNDWSVKIKGKYNKLTENEKKRLKKIYKSRSIRKYGYLEDDCIGYGIFFNKNEFQCKDKQIRNQKLKKHYPNLSKYILAYNKDLKNVLINAKEDENDIFFPRRGAFIKNYYNKNQNLIELEKSYDIKKKIFFKYISDSNIFGYSETQYYATSDTYFLWPKIDEEKMDYLFLLAYLNSRFVYFLFKAKNISIKRSKSKLEYNLPIPNFKFLNSESDKIIISLIRIFTSFLIKYSKINLSVKISKLYDELNSKINKTDCIRIKILENVQKTLKSKDYNKIQDIVDDLFFMLFKIKRETIEDILTKYYE
ncbi:MAG: Eco57I restriction-modification methylase domain-containing protein [Candidatus Lokiarchaeota archaeon]|nr:Eco57I restriction-modification methylase domain-containing protein [Candidatus Lokiarchaeota archaeon]